MTYQEQLQIEQLSRENFTRITTSISAKEFIEYYKKHTKAETKDFYNINNDRTLKRILNFFNYDWSIPKSKKGKPTGRTHESYLAAGKKSAETQKKHWEEKSADEKEAWSAKQKEAHSTESFRKIIRQINLDYQANLTKEEQEEIRGKKRESNKATWDRSKKEILEKAYLTKSNNNSWNVSSAEENYYRYLLTKFSKDDIERQYKDKARYPHCCDFYIRSLDLFIELNIDWTHGGHKFDAANPADKNKLAIWEEKAKESKFYLKAIDTWTRLDIEKYADAVKHNLNYLAFYTEEDALAYKL